MDDGLGEGRVSLEEGNRPCARWRERGKGTRVGSDGDNGLRRYHIEGVCRVGTGTPKIVLDHRFELGEGGVVDGELPLEIRAHLALHLVDLAKIEHALSDDGPRIVPVSVVADDFRCDHECRNKQSVTRGAAGCGEASLKALEEHECGKCDALMELGAMEGICDKKREHGLGMGG